MDDTSEAIKARQHKYWMGLPEGERFRRCGEMFTLAKAAAIARAPAGLTESERKWFVISELYGADFVGMMRQNDE